MKRNNNKNPSEYRKLTTAVNSPQQNHWISTMQSSISVSPSNIMKTHSLIFFFFHNELCLLGTKHTHKPNIHSIKQYNIESNFWWHKRMRHKYRSTCHSRTPHHTRLFDKGLFTRRHRRRTQIPTKTKTKNRWHNEYRKYRSEICDAFFFRQKQKKNVFCAARQHNKFNYTFIFIHRTLCYSK